MDLHRGRGKVEDGCFSKQVYINYGGGVSLVGLYSYGDYLWSWKKGSDLWIFPSGGARSGYQFMHATNHVRISVSGQKVPGHKVPGHKVTILAT